MTDNSLVFCEAFELSNYKEDSDLVRNNSLVLCKASEVSKRSTVKTDSSSVLCD